MLKRFHSVIVGMLVAALIVSPMMGYAQSPAGSSAVAAKPKPDLDYVTPEAVAGVVAYPRAVLTAPQLELMPVEVLSAAGKKELGIDPVEIEQALVIAEPPAGGPPGVAIVLKMTEPIGSGRILAPLWERTTEGTLNGKTYRKAKGPMDVSIFQADEKTLIVGTDALLQKMVAAHAAPPKAS